MSSKTNPYTALVRRLEMTLARQKSAVVETELQLEAAVAMQVETAKAMASQAELDIAPGGKRARS